MKSCFPNVPARMITFEMLHKFKGTPVAFRADHRPMLRTPKIPMTEVVLWKYQQEKNNAIYFRVASSISHNCSLNPGCRHHCKLSYQYIDDQSGKKAIVLRSVENFQNKYTNRPKVQHTPPIVTEGNGNKRTGSVP